MAQYAKEFATESFQAATVDHPGQTLKKRVANRLMKEHKRIIAEDDKLSMIVSGKRGHQDDMLRLQLVLAMPCAQVDDIASMSHGVQQAIMGGTATAPDTKDLEKESEHILSLLSGRRAYISTRLESAFLNMFGALFPSFRWRYARPKDFVLTAVPGKPFETAKALVPKDMIRVNTLTFAIADRNGPYASHGSRPRWDHYAYLLIVLATAKVTRVRKDTTESLALWHELHGEQVNHTKRMNSTLAKPTCYDPAWVPVYEAILRNYPRFRYTLKEKGTIKTKKEKKKRKRTETPEAEPQPVDIVKRPCVAQVQAEPMQTDQGLLPVLLRIEGLLSTLVQQGARTPYIAYQ